MDRILKGETAKALQVIEVSRVRDSRRANLRAALGFLRLQPELQFPHRWLDTWTGVGLVTAGGERRGYRLSPDHIAEGEWRATFMSDNARLARGADAVASRARAAWATVNRVGR